MKFFQDRRDETISHYILQCELIFFLCAGIFLLRLSNLTIDNFYTKIPVLILLFGLVGVIPLTQKIKTSQWRYAWALELIISVAYVVLISYFIENQYDYLFKLSLLMPVIVIALKYGLRMAIFAALLSISANLFLSYKQGFVLIDGDIVFSQIIILLAWLLGKMTEKEYDIKIDLHQEISARKLAEKHLKDQLCFLQNLIDTIPNPLYFTDLNLIFMGCNKSFADLIGLTKDEIVNQYIYDILPSDFAHKLNRVDDAFSQSGVTAFEFTVTNANGSVQEVILNKAAFFDNEGNDMGSLGIIIDISEQKQFQKDMAQVDRLNVIGQMAAGIAHEIRNPITTVRGFIQLFQMKHDVKTFEENLDLMIEELDRANEIITEYLSLAKNKPLNLIRQNLNSIILSIGPLIEADAAMSDNNLSLHLGTVPDGLFDESQIRQMLLNLCHNGIEAMTSGGHLIITTLAEDKDIVLTIEDQGKGIGPEIINKIGTPFVTSKANGTGLGLAVCYSIAARHNATITFETTSQGTTFIVRFKKHPQ